jgi:NAD(P)-dependent dehydrogenase (short-subunit alcohol dehydrogenase family)
VGKFEQLAGRRVVITGASSGIGRETARLAAEAGAHVVVSARRAAELAEVVDACNGPGQVLALTADVGVEDEVQHLADHAVAHLGGIDVWVNNAAVGFAGRFEDVPPHLFRAVVETNIFGVANGCRAALRTFRAQGSGGVIVNVGSAVADVAPPLQAPYNLSKAAVVSLTHTLRQELRHDDGVEVTVVMPGAVHTPFWELMGNVTGTSAHAPATSMSAERAARAVLGAACSPRRQRRVGIDARLLGLGHRVLPGVTDRVVALLFPRLVFGGGSCAPTAGNVLEGARRESVPR